MLSVLTASTSLQRLECHSGCHWPVLSPETCSSLSMDCLSCKGLFRCCEVACHPCPQACNVCMDKDRVEQLCLYGCVLTLLRAIHTGSSFPAVYSVQSAVICAPQVSQQYVCAHRRNHYPWCLPIYAANCQGMRHGVHGVSQQLPASSHHGLDLFDSNGRNGCAHTDTGVRGPVVPT